LLGAVYLVPSVSPSARTRRSKSALIRFDAWRERGVGRLGVDALGVGRNYVEVTEITSY